MFSFKLLKKLSTRHQNAYKYKILDFRYVWRSVGTLTNDINTSSVVQKVSPHKGNKCVKFTQLKANELE